MLIVATGTIHLLRGVGTTPKIEAALNMFSHLPLCLELSVIYRHSSEFLPRFVEASFKMWWLMMPVVHRLSSRLLLVLNCVKAELILVLTVSRTRGGPPGKCSQYVSSVHRPRGQKVCVLVKCSIEQI